MIAVFKSDMELFGSKKSTTERQRSCRTRAGMVVDLFTGDRAQHMAKGRAQALIMSDRG